jgi:hypothetical protein
VAARRFKRGLTLPWERRADALRAAFQNARWKLVVLVVAVLAVGWVIYRAADQHVKIRETRAAIADVHRAIAAICARSRPTAGATSSSCSARRGSIPAERTWCPPVRAATFSTTTT